MTIIAILSVLVLALGLVIFLICAGLTKGNVAEIGKICFFCGLLAFLMSAGGAQSCSMGVVNGGGGHSSSAR